MINKPVLSKEPAVEKRGAMAIVASVRIHEFERPAINYYILEDGTEVCETDDGEAATWPPAEAVAMAEVQE